MKQIIEYLSTKVVQSKIKATNETIKKIVKEELDRLGNDADLNHIDVSEVTTMIYLFSHLINPYVVRRINPKHAKLNPDISKWDVSNVEDMDDMFRFCSNFNCDISEWNVSNVRNMGGMFAMCEKFNQDISDWDVSNVKDMHFMFYRCKKFNQNLSGWDIRNIKDANNMFEGCPIKEKYKPKFNI